MISTSKQELELARRATGLPVKALSQIQEREETTEWEDSRCFIATFVGGTEVAFLSKVLPNLSSAINVSGDGVPLPSFRQSRHPSHIVLRADMVLAIREVVSLAQLINPEDGGDDE